MNTNKGNKSENSKLHEWETPVLLELDASLSEGGDFTNADDGDTGPMTS